MSKTVANLTLALVTDEIEQIETVLKTYPEHPYQQAFAVPDWRQPLIAYVLSRIPNTYKVIEGTEPVVDQRSVYFCLERRLQIEALLYQGIWQILQQNSAWASHPASKNIEICTQYS